MPWRCSDHKSLCCISSDLSLVPTEPCKDENKFCIVISSDQCMLPWHVHPHYTSWHKTIIKNFKSCHNFIPHILSQSWMYNNYLMILFLKFILLSSHTIEDCVNLWEESTVEYLHSWISETLHSFYLLLYLFKDNGKIKIVSVLFFMKDVVTHFW